VLSELVAETLELKGHRTNGTLYLKKCAELLERIKMHCDTVKGATLTAEQADKLNLIKSGLATEEVFAKESFDIRTSATWKDFIDE
jgi:hypothetical protein